MFNNDVGEIVRTYDLSIPKDTDKVKTKSKRKKRASLPGSISTSGLVKGERRSYKKRDVLPIFELTTFGDEHLEAEAFSPKEGVNIIRINVDNIHVDKIIHMKGTSYTTSMLKIAAWAIFKEKWMRKEGSNSLNYEIGMQKDVSEFMKTAKKLKII